MTRGKHRRPKRKADWVKNALRRFRKLVRCKPGTVAKAMMVVYDIEGQVALGGAGGEV
jgi:hypothetical protein